MQRLCVLIQTLHAMKKRVLGSSLAIKKSTSSRISPGAQQSSRSMKFWCNHRLRRGVLAYSDKDVLCSTKTAPGPISTAPRGVPCTPVIIIGSPGTRSNSNIGSKVVTYPSKRQEDDGNPQALEPNGGAHRHHHRSRRRLTGGISILSSLPSEMLEEILRRVRIDEAYNNFGILVRYQLASANGTAT
ncbi:hypothetical protein EJB05_24072, partial [Eragrostis curvula]